MEKEIVHASLPSADLEGIVLNSSARFSLTCIGHVTAVLEMGDCRRDTLDLHINRFNRKQDSG